MVKLWDKKDYLFYACRAVINACTLTSFSHFKVEGRENIPTDAAVIFAPCHRCTLMDALVMVKASGFITAFGARADLFKKPFLASILRWMRIVPLARHDRDGFRAAAGNTKVFADVVDCMGHGVPFCIYVEGTHYPDRVIHQVRQGVFRIADLYKETFDKPVYIVPVGLDYDYFFDYMKGVTVRYGEAIPFDTLAELDNYKKADILHERMQPLISAEDPERNHGNVPLRLLAAILLLPVLVVCIALSFHLLLLTRLFSRKLKDRAWINTIRYCCSLLFPIHWPFHRGFYLINNFYRDLISDL